MKLKNTKANTKGIILFDGTCNLCNNTVQFLLPKDKNNVLLFGSLQSEKGIELIKKYEIPSSVDSIIFIVNNQAFYYADALLKIAAQLGGFYRIFFLAYLIPRKIRNSFYRWIAKNRINWFGGRDKCLIPDKKWQNKFIG